jgi:4-amino-4-deoxy-L-arabinose transferase-like glycosyltransferase
LRPMPISAGRWFEKNYRLALLALVVVAVATRIALVANAPRPFGYVWDLYHEGVMQLYDHGRLPSPTDCWECYPPPLYFIVGVPFYAIGKFAAGGAAAGGLRLLALFSMLCAALVVYYCDRTLRLLKAPKEHLLAATALALVFPCLFIGSYAAESDILLTALMGAFFYRLCRYHLKPGGSSWREPLILGILAGLCGLTKYSGLLALAVMAALMGLRFLRGWRRPRVARDFSIALLAAVAVCGWHYAGNWRSAHKLFRAPPWLSNLNAAKSFSHNLARYDFSSFKIREVVDLYRPEIPGTLDEFPVYHSVFSTLHALAWTDMTFFSLPVRQPWRLPLHYGEGGVLPMVVTTPARAIRVAAYPAKRVRLWLIDLVLRAGLVPTILALIGFTVTLRRRALEPFRIYAGITFVAYFWWLLGQDSWAVKTKYILFLLPVYIVYAILGVRAAFRLNPRFGRLAVACLIASLLVSEAYLWTFALG